MSQKWTAEAISALFDTPFLELLYQAQKTHRDSFSNTDIELCALLSIKTGTCPEDCKYCPQSGHYKTGLQKEKLWDVDAVMVEAQKAKDKGAKRFCMGAAWRSPPKKDFPKVLEMIQAVKSLGMEACVTLGTLDAEQAEQLKAAGLDYYNHNLDTSRSYYKEIISTRTYDQRIETLQHVHNAGVNVCCGGIIGMGETREDRVKLLWELTQLPQNPDSIPINQLIPIPGTPLAFEKGIDSFEFVRTIAVTRLVFPQSVVRLSAGREKMSPDMQALCFMAGANSVFFGEELLTAPNASEDSDQHLFQSLNLTPTHSKPQPAAVET